MRDRIVGLLEKIDAAVSESVGVIDESSLRPIAEARNHIRDRLAYPDDLLLVALVGGTGSGKSSLFNAIAGEEIAEVGGLRPTTSKPLALVPARHARSVAGLLDSLGIDEAHTVDGPDWICLIDMPDIDSLELDHRQSVADLIPRVDSVLWLLDPEKYRDAALHNRFIAPLASYHRQFLFVLNQVDRLRQADVDLIVADLVHALEEDGIPEPRVLAVAAAPTAGPPVGMDALVGALGDLRRGRSAVYDKVLADLRAANEALVDAMGGGRSLDFERRWGEMLDEVARLVSDSEGSAAGHLLATWLNELAEQAGGELRSSILSMADDASPAVSDAIEQAGPPRDESPDEPRSFFSRFARSGKGEEGSDVTPDRGESVRKNLDSGVGGELRQLLAGRARSVAAINDLSLFLDGLE